jgi:nicotinate-nucleotide pyrophosphorylase
MVKIEVEVDTLAELEEALALARREDKPILLSFLAKAPVATNLPINRRSLNSVALVNSW